MKSISIILVWIMLTTTTMLLLLQHKVAATLLERYALTNCDKASITTDSEIPSFIELSSFLKGLQVIGNFQCDPSRGMSIDKSNTNNKPMINDKSMLRSIQSAQALQRYYTTINTHSGFTVSLWFIPMAILPQSVNGSLDYEQPILTLEENSMNGSSSESISMMYGACAILRIAQWQQQLIISFTDPFGVCRYLVVREYTLLDNIWTNVVVSFDPASYVSVYVNGDVLVSNATRTIKHIATWDAINTKLLLFANSRDKAMFMGHIQQLDLYDEIFAPSDAAHLFQEGIFIVQRKDLVLLTPHDLEIIIPQNDKDGSEVLLRVLPQHSIGALTLALQVITLSTQGHITMMHQEIMEGGVVLLPSDDTNVPLWYTLHSNESFNVPKYNAYGFRKRSPPDYFTYRLVALHPQTLEILHSSAEVQVPIHVVHVNHPPSITFPNATTKVTSDVDGSTYQVVTEPIEYIDPLDANMDRVRVHVSCNAGRLTLALAYRHLADFDTCRWRSLSNWQCVGTGEQDRTMIFIATPSDIRYIFKNLLYTPFTQGRNDTIHIRIHDGAGEADECLHRIEHEQFSKLQGNRFTTLHPVCWERNAQIVVPANKEDTMKNKGTNHESSSLLEYLFWGLLTSVSLMCTCCGGKVLSTIPHCLAKGNPVVPEIASSESST